jgi:hypothetical protein
MPESEVQSVAERDRAKVMTNQTSMRKAEEL